MRTPPLIMQDYDFICCPKLINANLHIYKPQLSHDIQTYVPVEKDLGRVSRLPQPRKDEVGCENSQAAEQGEEAEEPVDGRQSIVERATKLRTLCGVATVDAVETVDH